jgi:hypothetical protein
VRAPAETGDAGAVEPHIAIGEKDLSIIAATYDVLISIGEPGMEDLLVRTLNAHGDQQMAESYLNCGNDQLETAARAWADAHGYNVIARPGAGGPKWGSAR